MKPCRSIFCVSELGFPDPAKVHRVVCQATKTGFFSNSSADVDGFLKFSLGVHKRRSSRAGYSALKE
nr:type II restriction endonuclease [Ruegeria arenilitoris]